MPTFTNGHPTPNSDTSGELPQIRVYRSGFTVNELAALWRCNPQLIYRRIRHGKIRAFKVGGGWRISTDEVDRLEALRTQPMDDLEAHIAALVEAAPPLSDQQRIRISALLLTGGGHESP